MNVFKGESSRTSTTVNVAINKISARRQEFKILINELALFMNITRYDIVKQDMNVRWSRTVLPPCVWRACPVWSLSRGICAGCRLEMRLMFILCLSCGSQNNKTETWNSDFLDNYAFWFSLWTLNACSIFCLMLMCRKKKAIKWSLVAHLYQAVGLIIPMLGPNS